MCSSTPTKSEMTGERAAACVDEDQHSVCQAMCAGKFTEKNKEVKVPNRCGCKGAKML